MVFRILFLLLITLQGGTCINRAKYQTFPPPQKNFDVHKYIGNWYYAAKLPPCSFVGSFDFTNSVTQYSLQPDGVLDQKCTYRSTACTIVELTQTPTGSPGIYETKDPIGNPISGPSVIIATDYKRFAIIWGCPKAVGNSCQDPSLYILSRRKEPKPATWKLIEQIIQSLYEMSLEDMIRVIHDENACVTFEDQPKYPYSPYHMSIDHLKKTY